MTTPRRSPLGRKPLLDAKRQTEICAVIGAGCTLRMAAAYVGCNESTIYRFAQRDADFAAALRKARAKSEMVLLRCVHEAATQKKDWRAATWLLTHCHQERYRMGTELLAADQVSAMIGRFAELLLREVADVADRKRILARLEDLTSSLGREAATAVQLEVSP